MAEEQLTTREFMQSLLDQGIEDWEEIISQTVKKMRVTRGHACGMYKRITGRGARKSSGPRRSCSPAPAGMNRKQFMSKYDINTKTREALQRGVASLKQGDDPNEDEILEDSQFRMERCEGANPTGFRQIAQEDEFYGYQFKVGGKIFWSPLRTAEWALKNVLKARRIDE